MIAPRAALRIRFCRLRRGELPLLRWRRRDANRNQRLIGAGRLDATRNLPFADVVRRIACRSAIGAHQHFVAAARSAAHANETVQPDHPDRGAGRSLFALRSGRTGRPDWTRRPRGAGVAFRAGRTGRSRIALRGLAAGRQPERQKPRKYQISDVHFFSPLLPLTEAPHDLVRDVKIANPCAAGDRARHRADKIIWERRKGLT